MMLILIRVVQGIGAAMIFSTNTAVLLKAFPAENHGRVIGYSLAATYAGLSSGPVLGGFLNQHFGWKAIFIVTGVITTAACIAVFRLPGDKNVKNLKTDSCGESHHPLTDTDLHGKTLQQLVKKIKPAAGSRRTAHKATQPGSDWKFTLSDLDRSADVWAVGNRQGLDLTGAGRSGTGCGDVFLRHEYRTEEPAVDIRMFRENIGYGFSNLSALLNYGAICHQLPGIHLSAGGTGIFISGDRADHDRPAGDHGRPVASGRKLSDRFFSVQTFLYRNGSLCTRDVPLRFLEPGVPLDRHHSTDHNWVWFRSVLIA